jgi:hypothetical protein
VPIEARLQNKMAHNFNQWPLVNFKDWSNAELSVKPVNEAYPSLFNGKLRNPTGKAKSANFEDINLSLYEPAAKMIAFRVGAERLPAWVRAIWLRFYEEIGESDKFNVDWTQDPRPSKTLQIEINRRDTESTGSVYKISIFATTGTIQVQGTHYSQFSDTEFPRLRKMVSDIVELSKFNQPKSTVRTEGEITPTTISDQQQTNTDNERETTPTNSDIDTDDEGETTPTNSDTENDDSRSTLVSTSGQINHTPTLNIEQTEEKSLFYDCFSADIEFNATNNSSTASAAPKTGVSQPAAAPKTGVSQPATAPKTGVSQPAAVPESVIIDRLCLIESSVCELLTDIKAALHKESDHQINEETSENAAIVDISTTLKDVQTKVNQLTDNMNKKFSDLQKETKQLQVAMPEDTNTQIIELTAYVHKHFAELSHKTDNIQEVLSSVASTCKKQFTDQETQTTGLAIHTEAVTEYTPSAHSSSSFTEQGAQTTGLAIQTEAVIECTPSEHSPSSFTMPPSGSQLNFEIQSNSETTQSAHSQVSSTSPQPAKLFTSHVNITPTRQPAAFESPTKSSDLFILGDSNVRYIDSRRIYRNRKSTVVELKNKTLKGATSFIKQMKQQPSA